MSNLPMVVPVEPNQPLDLRRGWATISRSAWIIVVCVGLAVAAGVVAAQTVSGTMLWRLVAAVFSVKRSGRPPMCGQVM